MRSKPILRRSSRAFLNAGVLVFLAVSGVVTLSLVVTGGPSIAQNDSERLGTAEQNNNGAREPDSNTRDLASAGEEVNSLRARLAAESSECLKLSHALESATAAAAEQRQAIEREREKSAALKRELEMARQEIEELTALADRASNLHAPAFFLGTPRSVRTTTVPAQSQQPVAPAPSPR